MNALFKSKPARRGIGIFRCFAMAGAVALIWLGKPRALRVEPQPLVEAVRSDLTLRDDRWYRNGEEQPFSGALIEYYPGGLLKSRSMMSNGVLHGVSEGWHTNRQIQVREFFDQAVSHGVRTKWYLSGQKLSEASIVRGELQGTYRRWHESGALAEEVELKSGIPDGISLAYFPSGFLRTKAILEQGRVRDQKSWNDGEATSAREGVDP